MQRTSDSGHYDPLEAPEPEEWLAIDEAKRIQLARDYHRRARVRLPNEKLHAVFHVVVENQIALGDEIPVQSTLQRLMAEGLDRHEAIHAIASVLAEAIDMDVRIDEVADVSRLTPPRWDGRLSSHYAKVSTSS